jgi:transketolase
LALTRQNLPHQPRSSEQVAAIKRGGYALVECDGTPECIVIATGSEIGIAAEAVRELGKRGRRVRLVSMPSFEVFARNDVAYRERVLPPSVRKRVAVEAGVTTIWRQFVGEEGRIIGIDHFGASGKGADLFKHFGFTAQHVLAAVEQLLGAH